mgnify:CR=1 FL=1
MSDSKNTKKLISVIAASSVGTTVSRPEPVRGVIATPLPNGERLLVEFGREVSFNLARLGSPERLEVTFADAAGSAAATQAVAALTGPLTKGARLSSTADRRVTLSLPVGAGARVSAFPIYDPYRVVIDIERQPSSTAGPPRGRWPALSLPRLEVRCARPLPRDTG